MSGDGAAPASADAVPSQVFGLRRALLRYLPRTMTGLVAAGCMLAATPLLAMVLIYGVMLERFTQRVEALLDEGLRLERIGAQLRDNLDDLERGGLQYIALDDPQLLPVIERRRASAEESLRRIREKPLPSAVATDAERVEQGLAELAANWQPQTATPAQLQEAIARTHELGAVVDQIVDAGRVAIDERIHQLHEQSRQVRRLTPFAILLMLPLTGLLAFACSIAITRPLGALHRGIAALGSSNYKKPVQIVYPREMSRLGEQLDWLRRRLRHLELDKDRFLRHISHELKTPLASLREGVDLLGTSTLGPLNGRQSEVCAILAEATEELDAQIRNLLAYAAWRRERRRAESEWFDALPLIDSVLSAHRLPMTRRYLRAEVRTQAPRLYGQRELLRVALDNLLSNAVKHAPAHSVIEIVSRCGSGTCELSVRDHGRGVLAEDRERILEPFVRGSEAEESGIRGTGVGLSIVNETVMAHGGRLEVQDAHPGARFVLVWPSV